MATVSAQVINDMPAAEYHAHPATSNSKLSDYLESPELYYLQHERKLIPPKKQTPDQMFGTLFHDAVLLGLETQAIEVPAEVLDAAGKRTGAKWKAFAAEHAGKSCLLADEYARLRNMVEAVWSHPLASKLLDPDGAVCEQSIFWEDPETGLELRSRLDHRNLLRPRICDLKSTVDVSRDAFAKSMLNFGYYRQAPFYIEAARAVTGEYHRFVFIAVEKTQPHRVRCFELDPREDRALTKGYEDMRAGLEMLAESKRTNHWKERGWDEVLTLDLPSWAYTNQWGYDDGDSATA